MKDKKVISPLLDRLSLLSAIILLAYALTPFVNLPEISSTWRLLGVILEFNINFQTYISILLPALAAVGTYWLIDIHPSRKMDQYALHHSILPAVTAWVIGLPLTQQLSPYQRGIVFALGGSLLLVVFAAEYIVVDPTSEYHTIASGILKALSLALYLFLAIAVQSAGLRLYLSVPALTIPALLVLLRTFYLQSGGKWLLGWSIGITLIIGQMSLVLHYLPVSPLTFGLLLIAPFYTLLDFAISQQQTIHWQGALIGPGVISIILIILAFLF